MVEEEEAAHLSKMPWAMLNWMRCCSASGGHGISNIKAPGKCQQRSGLEITDSNTQDTSPSAKVVPESISHEKLYLLRSCFIYPRRGIEVTVFAQNIVNVGNNTSLRLLKIQQTA